ncbi:MAG: hypothetical protein JJD97_12390 [Gemmatimonadaceae bacterium]|nr:hypothetical protein [Gemmatimonadaceae bacterium]
MSAPFVTSLRTSGSTIPVGAPGASPITIRVEVPERWEVALISAAPTASVSDVKRAALRFVSPDDDAVEYVIKLRGFEVLDEDVTLADAGARDGSIFLLTHRRRRPVR